MTADTPQQQRDFDKTSLITHRPWKVHCMPRAPSKVAGRERAWIWGPAFIEVEGKGPKVLRVYLLSVNFKHKSKN